MTNYSGTFSKLESKKATIGVVGLGYVGLPLINTALSAGFSTIGFDVDQKKIDLLSKGQNYIEHVDASILIEAIKKKTVAFFSTKNEIQKCDVIVLCLPTPLNKHREPDLSYVVSSLEEMLPFMKAGQLLVLESTTYPGTTEEKLQPILEMANFQIGENFFLAYSPEREDPGNKSYSVNDIPKVVSGVTQNCLSLAELFYSQIGCQTVPVSSPKVAEMTKILENTYRSVNIALVNELKVLADLMDIDIFEVIEAASTKPFGYQAFYPGPGLGGHCIPIDPFYLTWKAREYNFHTRFIELAGEINTAMPDYVISKIQSGLNQMSKSINDAKILIIGVAYKKNVGDVRESPGIEIIDKLTKLGGHVSYHDPYVDQIPDMRKYDLKMRSIELNIDTIRNCDICVLITDHDNLDYDLINNAQLIVDTRGKISHDNSVKVIKA